MEARVEMKNKNEMSLEFDALSVNEAFARTVVAAFVAQLNPTLDELSDVKTAVSEAVTNSIIHGYEMEPGKIVLSCQTKENEVQIVVEDSGKGIEDVEKAKEPFFRQNRNWSALEWASHLWRRSWMRSRSSRRKVRERR